MMEVIQEMARVLRPAWKATVIDMLMKRDRYICCICNQAMQKGELYEIHHVVPKSKGGDDSLKNLVAVHLTCHKLKHNPKHSRIEKDNVPQRGMMGTLRDRVKQVEIMSIMEWLDKTNGNITKTAEVLDISRPQLYDKMKKYGIQRKAQ